MAAPGPGRLLVANPLLPDSNFDRSVVLLLAHSPEGALGVILNRPTTTGLDAVLPAWETFATVPPVLFEGGPVQRDGVLCLARVLPGEDPVPGGPGWARLLDDVGTLDLELDPEVVGDRVAELRVFSGYAGWAAGQLEGELEAEAWWVVPAEAGDPFSAKPERLWAEVLRRQRGPLQLVSSYPEDPTAN